MLLHARTFTPRFTYGTSHLTTCDGFITLGSSPVGSSSMLLSLPNSCNLSFPITDLSLAHLRSWRSVWPGSALHSCFRKILFSFQGFLCLKREPPIRYYFLEKLSKILCNISQSGDFPFITSSNAFFCLLER